MTPQELLAEAEIQQALARGDEKAIAGTGKPLDLDAYFATPPDVRMAFSLLKSVELVPEELELLKEINRLEEEVANEPNETSSAALRVKISELSALYDMKMQSYRRNAVRR